MRYSLVAVDFLPPPAVQSTLSRLAADLASGALRPLPRVVHSLAAVRAALRQMSQARHVGKIVVRAHTLDEKQGVDKVRSGWQRQCDKPPLQHCIRAASHRMKLASLGSSALAT